MSRRISARRSAALPSPLRRAADDVQPEVERERTRSDAGGPDPDMVSGTLSADFEDSPVRSAPLAIAAVLLAALTACTQVRSGSSSGDTATAGSSAGSSNGTSNDSAIAVGPGPESHYAVQAQPAPGSCHYGSDDNQPLPDPNCTPGAVSPAVTQANLATTICRKGGYTSGVRPPVSVTDKEKIANAKSYGYTGSLGDAEYDHLVSLEIGGDPNDPQNLWIEPPSPGHRAGSGISNPKDKVEARLHTAVCTHQVTLAAAQQAIAHNWVTAEQVLGIKPSGT